MKEKGGEKERKGRKSGWRKKVGEKKIKIVFKIINLKKDLKKNILPSFFPPINPPTNKIV